MQIEFNRKHTLKINTGESCGPSQGCSEDYRVNLIGSDITPIEIGRTNSGETGNGERIVIVWWIISQNDKLFVIEYIETDHYHGFSWQSSEATYKVLDLPVSYENLHPQTSS